MVRVVNLRKSPGTDGVTGRVLKERANQLSEVFTEIFNLSQSIIPHCLKYLKIIPLLKKKPPSSASMTTGHQVHQSQHSTCLRLMPVCIQSKQICKGCHSRDFSHGTDPSWMWYIKLLFVDINFVFHSIRASRLNSILTDLGLFQPFVIGSGTFRLSTVSSKGSVFSPLCYTLYTHGCTLTYSTAHLRGEE